MRPVNCAAASVLTGTGAFVAGINNQYVAASVAVVATTLAVGAGNAINDYFDREIDAINQPERAIPRGAVSPRGAVAFSMVLFAAAVALALTLPPVAVGIALVNFAALVTYTEFFKGTPGLGNALVAYLVGSTFLFGGAAVGGLAAPLVLGFLAGMSTFAREVIKDVEDIAGDREEGLRTLPIAVGKRRSLWIATAALGVAVAVSPMPFLLGMFGAIYIVLVVVADCIMLYACFEGFEAPTAAQTRFKYGMFLAAAAFVVGRASLLV